MDRLQLVGRDEVDGLERQFRLTARDSRRRGPLAAAAAPPRRLFAGRSRVAHRAPFLAEAISPPSASSRAAISRRTYPASRRPSHVILALRHAIYVGRRAREGGIAQGRSAHARWLRKAHSSLFSSKAFFRSASAARRERSYLLIHLSAMSWMGTGLR